MAKCKNCNKEAIFYAGLKPVCSGECAFDLAKKALDKKRRKEEREFKAETIRRRRALRENDRSWWMKKAQTYFNRYIRDRDKGKPCISCGRATGAKMNAGHYRSVGACPELRFEPLNCHLQCEHCNSYKSGNITEYRKNLVSLIGLSKVEWLEGPHKPKKYTIDDLREICKQYEV